MTTANWRRLWDARNKIPEEIPEDDFEYEDIPITCRFDTPWTPEERAELLDLQQ